jgi:hypothetical protein
MTSDGELDESGGNDTVPELSVSLDTICFIIAKAREFDVKTAASDPDTDAMDEDDLAAAVLEDRPSDPVYRELVSVISDLSDDGQIDLVALMWLGRSDGGLEEWEEHRRLAAEEHNDVTAAYLCGTPLLGDHLESGLAEFGLDCTAFLEGHA